MMGQAQARYSASTGITAEDFGWPREHDRMPVLIPACCRTRTGFRDYVVITDISAGGCRVECRAAGLRPGDQVVIRPEGLQPLTGVVCWVEDYDLGVKFDHAMYGPVVEHISRKFANILGSATGGEAGGYASC